MFRAGLYARVSTNDQQTLAMQNLAMREYAARRGWTVAMQVREVGSGAAKREAREKLLEAARRREIDLVLVWRLDRWGRSVTDLLATLQELEHLGVGFVSLTEALDLTTPAGRAMAGLLAIFAEFEREILRERTKAGLAHARENGKRLGRPATAALHAAEVRKLRRAGISADRAFANVANEVRSMKSQMKSAGRSGAAFAVIVGEDEVANGTVTVRDLRGQAGDARPGQESIERNQLVDHLRSRLTD